MLSCLASCCYSDHKLKGWLQHSVRDAVQKDIVMQRDKCCSYQKRLQLHSQCGRCIWCTQPPITQQHTTTYDRRLHRTFRALLSDLKDPKRTASEATLTNESDMKRAIQRAKDALTARYGSPSALHTTGGSLRTQMMVPFYKAKEAETIPSAVCPGIDRSCTRCVTCTYNRIF
jgi:hypothetical protein